jgi:hypothetical protein
MNFQAPIEKGRHNIEIEVMSNTYLGFCFKKMISVGLLLIVKAHKLTASPL